MKTCVLCSLILVLFAVTSAPAMTPHLVDVNVDFPAHGIVRTTLVFQEGPNPLNRFTMQRAGWLARRPIRAISRPSRAQ